MKTILNIKTLCLLVFAFSLQAPNLFSQSSELTENSWFVHSAKDLSTNIFLDDILNTDSELRFEVTFSNDKIILSGCCGGAFEMDVNYIGNDSIQILNLTETETINCNSSFVLDFYNTTKGAFNNLIGSPINYQISSYSQILYLNINNQNNSNFVKLTNIPLEDTDYSTSPYWGHEPPNHQWSLTQVTYQGQTMELPYGAALTVADLFEGAFTISLCGEIFVALNSSWYLDVEEPTGPCFISCGILENTAGSCVPVAGYDITYLESFKQNAYNFLIDNMAQTMEYEFYFGTSSHNARKLIIYDFSGNKLTFHSTENYLNTPENDLISEISIYPNPVLETLQINQTNYQYSFAIIYDLQGKNLGQHLLKNSKSTIDVKSFIAGLYFLVLESEKGERVTQKFVKK